MRKLLSYVVAAMLLFPTIVNAQEAHSKKDWKPYGFVQYQLGVGTTFTNTNACDLLQPTMSAGVGYMAIPELGLRFNVNGFWSKGGFNSISDKYFYKYVMGDFDILYNLTNMFSKDKMRPFNLFLVTGIGVDYAWGNDIANLPLDDVTENVSNKWGSNLKQKDFWGTNFRVGLLGDYRIGRHWSLGLEVDLNPITDDFNSKFDGGKNRDWMLNTQLSLTYKFWKKGAKSEEPIVRTPVEPTKEKPVVVRTKVRLDDKSLEGQGKYRVAEYDPKSSASSKKMLDDMAKQIRTECAPYIKEGGKVDIIFTGSADAIPVLGIKYNGKDVYDLPVSVSGTPITMTLTQAAGIKTNEQLALARALKAKDYVYQTVPGLESMKATHYYNVKVSDERGIEYRTVDVEFIFYGK